MPSHQSKYQHIDHTADVGIKVYGATLAQLFEHAALGLFDIIADLDKVDLTVERRVRVSSQDLEELLVTWLSELNYLFFTEREIYKEFYIEKMTKSELTARVLGEALDLDRHQIHTEVKAVTYHKLFVEETDRGWEAQIIFDL